MSDIIEELLETFRSSSQRLEGLVNGLEDLQDAQKKVEALSSNLGEAATSLSSTSAAHQTFIQSAQETDAQLGQVISVLQGLDTQAINKTLTKISSDLTEHKSAISNVVEVLQDVQAKSAEIDTNIIQIKQELETVVNRHKSLSEQSADNQEHLLRRTDEAAALATSRHKQSIFLILLAIGCTAVIVLNSLGIISV